MVGLIHCLEQVLICARPGISQLNPLPNGSVILDFPETGMGFTSPGGFS